MKQPNEKTINELIDLLFWLVTDSGIELDGHLRDSVGKLRHVLDESING